MLPKMSFQGMNASLLESDKDLMKWHQQTVVGPVDRCRMGARLWLLRDTFDTTTYFRLLGH